jgi:2-polyprenyl-3-methyl-5-hydroxy-6-metoxy-1,4-benzoquinol methylase
MKSLLFDVYYRFYDKFMSIFKLDEHQAIVSRVKIYAGNRRLKIADIGGGTGLLANTLIGLGHEVTIIDPAKKMTAIAQKLNPQVMIINQTLENTTPERTYDVIILRDCLHHIKAQAEALGKIFEILQDNGLLIIQEFSPDCISAKCLFQFERCCWEKVYPIPPSELVLMMTEADFISTINRLNSRDYLVTGIKGKREGGK